MKFIRKPKTLLQESDSSLSEAGRWQDTLYSRLAADRVLFMSEDVSKELGSSLCAMLLYFDHQDESKEITLYINSNGGDVTALSNIYDVMQMMRAPIKTICIGKAYSAAAVLLAAGTKGRRFATRNADIMIHGLQVQFPQSLSADSVDTEIDYRMLRDHNDLLMKILSRHTGKSAQKIGSDCERDLFMDPEEALKYGIIDAIL